MASVLPAAIDAPPAPSGPSPIVFALRVALAAAVAFPVAEFLHLRHANLAVWTTYMVMAQFSYTAFQKGFERVLGRGVGILGGLLLATVLGQKLFLNLFVEATLLVVFSYFYFANRLAYASLNAGLYMVVVNEIGRQSHDTVVVEAKGLFAAVVVGVVVSDLVLWITRAETTMTVDPGSAPLLPLRLDWFNRSLMLLATIELTRLATRVLDLPVEATLISVMVIVIAPDLHSLLLKGELRLSGAAAAGVWTFMSLVIIGRAPHMLVLMGLLFMGIFIAAYFTRTSGDYAYAGVQMGLVLGLTMVVPVDDIGNLAAYIPRIKGILTALFMSILVGAMWPGFALAKTKPRAATG